jgi:hypothetical protein
MLAASIGRVITHGKTTQSGDLFRVPDHTDGDGPNTSHKAVSRAFEAGQFDEATTNGVDAVSGVSRELYNPAGSPQVGLGTPRLPSV